MEGQRQRQDVLEIVMHHAQSVAMRHAVGEQTHRDIRPDAGKPDHRPDHQQLRRFLPQRSGRHPFRPREQVHHPAEQHGFEELQPGQRQRRDAKAPGQWAIGAKQPEHAPVEPQKPHAVMPPSAARESDG